MESEQPNQRETWNDYRLVERMKLIVAHADHQGLTLDDAAKEYVKAQKILTDGEDE